VLTLDFIYKKTFLGKNAAMSCEQINWINHFIDFVVIFLADVFAAFVAINIFERSKEKKVNERNALNRLSPLVEYLTVRLEGAGSVPRSSPTTGKLSIWGDLDSTIREIFELRSDKDFLSSLNSKTRILVKNAVARVELLRHGLPKEEFDRELNALRSELAQLRLIIELHKW